MVGGITMWLAKHVSASTHPQDRWVKSKTKPLTTLPMALTAERGQTAVPTGRHLKLCGLLLTISAGVSQGLLKRRFRLNFP